MSERVVNRNIAGSPVSGPERVIDVVEAQRQSEAGAKAVLIEWGGFVAGSVDLLTHVWSQFEMLGGEFVDHLSARLDLSGYFQYGLGLEVARRLQETQLLCSDDIIRIRWSALDNSRRYGTLHDKTSARNDVIALLDERVYSHTERVMRDHATRGSELMRPLAMVYGIAYTDWLNGLIQKQRAQEKADRRKHIS